MRLLLFPILLLAASGARAACSDAVLPGTLARLHPGATLDTEFSSCREWPMHPDHLLLVLARRRPDPQVPEEAFALEVDVVVADAADGRVLARFALPEAIESDAYRLSGVALDTARYRLAPGVDAFGLRVEHAGSSSVNPGTDTHLDLFAWDGRGLRHVLKQWPVASLRGENNGGFCGSDTESRRSLLAVQPRATHGLADLRVTETGEREMAIEDAYACHETVTTLSLPAYTLTFDGDAYDLHPASRARD